MDSRCCCPPPHRRRSTACSTTWTFWRARLGGASPRQLGNVLLRENGELSSTATGEKNFAVNEADSMWAHIGEMVQSSGSGKKTSWYRCVARYAACLNLHKAP